MEQSLAIASVPVQPWGELYDEQEAFLTGTIFPALAKPFFVTEQKKEAARGAVSNNERETLLLQISQLCFYLDDLTLYLDTHEQDTAAMEIYREKMQRCQELKQKYAAQYGPLTRNGAGGCAGSDSKCFCWLQGPAAWEGGCV